MAVFLLASVPVYFIEEAREAAWRRATESTHRDVRSVGGELAGVSPWLNVVEAEWPAKGSIVFPQAFLDRRTFLAAESVAVFGLAMLAAVLSCSFLPRRESVHQSLRAEREDELGAERLGREAVRARAERRHAGAEDRFRTLVEATSDWIWEVDDEGVYTYASPGVTGLLGYSPEEVVGLTPFDLMPDGEADRVRKVFFDIARDRRPFALLRNVNRRRDGRLIVLETSGTPILDEAGELLGYHGMDRDITERVAAESQLRKMSYVLERSGSGVMITDRDGCVEYVNPKFSKVTGFAEADILGKNPRVLRSEETRADVYKSMWDAMSHGRPWRGLMMNRRLDGTSFWCTETIHPMTGEDGRTTHYVAFIDELDGQAGRAIKETAMTDQLTGLPNRAAFLERLLHVPAGSEGEAAAATLAVFMIDLDHFQTLNDALGMEVGDQILRAVASRLAEIVGPDDLLARIGGDEFAMLMTNFQGREAVRGRGVAILDHLSRPFSVGGESVALTATMGVSVFPEDAPSAAALLRDADLALYRARETGREGIEFFTTDMDASVQERLELGQSLRGALERGEFVLHYQPQIDLETGEIRGAEALVRWIHPERGLISPDRFIPLAEETGFILPLGDWVLREACREASRWPTRVPPLFVAVNLSARQFAQQDLEDKIRAALDAAGLEPRALEVELTESLVMADPARSVDALRRLRDRGVGISIDDFGTGYSSLGYLTQLPLGVLKIDRSFVKEIDARREGRLIVSAMTALAHSLELRVVAEGVESETQLTYVKALGCDRAQGYLIGKPMAASELRSRLG